jgi:hypothetical protein
MSLVCLFYTIISFGAKDSIQKNNNRKINIGFAFAPASYLKWSFPEYNNVQFNQTSDEKKKDYSKKIVLFQTVGLHVGYSLFKSIKIETAMSYFKEEVNGIMVYETTDNYLVTRYLRSYITGFIQVPIIVNYRLADNSKIRTYTNCKAGLNFDFIFYEKHSYGTETVSSLSGSSISHVALNGRERPSKYSFNKITPFIFIGREHYNKNANFSFFYGSMFTFKPMYQKHNTAEYLKNYKITPIIIGFACHF